MASRVLDVFSAAMYHNNLFGSWRTLRSNAGKPAAFTSIRLLKRELIREMCLGCAESGKSRLLCLNIFVFVIPIMTDGASVIHCIRAVVKTEARRVPRTKTRPGV